MASLPVKEYLKSVTAEQLEARIIPKQATPLFLNKLLLLSRHLDCKLKEPNLSPTSLFVIARDQAFFKILFFSKTCDYSSLGPALGTSLHRKTHDSLVGNQHISRQIKTSRNEITQLSLGIFGFWAAMAPFHAVS